MRAARLAVALALVGAAAASGLVASAAPTRCAPGGTVDRVGSWLALRPTFTAGGTAVTLAAVPAFDPNLLYATNGTVVMRSTDAGCGWAPFWAVTALDSPTGTTARVTAMHVPSSANNSSFLYVGVTTGVDLEQLDGLRPTVVVLSPTGAVVADAEQGLPAVGVVREVTANAQVPQAGYAVVEVPAVGRQVFATTDGGATWQQRTVTGDPALATGLAVHPTAPTQLYGVAGGTVVRSPDGGAAFFPTALAGGVTALSVVPGGGGVLLSAAQAGQRAVQHSADRGDSWSRRSAPVVPTSVAKGPVARDRVAVADARQVWLLNRREIDLSLPGGAPTLLGLTAPTSTGYYVVGLRAGVLLQIALGFNDTPLPNGALRPVRLLPRGAVTQFPSTLSPAGLRVSLPPGGSARVPYQLLVPRTPAPVDLMFLLDSTGSMSGVFDSLRQGVAAITNALDAAGLDARFGLGDFRDYPAPWGHAGEDDWPYRLDRRIGPSGPEFEAAIEAVEPGGGTDDGGASPLTAVVQSTTGSGDRVQDRLFVRPGREAGYRRGALKIALLAHDTRAHEGGQPLPNGRRNPGPTFESTIRVLQRYGVHVMGLAIGPDPLPGLRRLAEGSDTLAPEGGVDCDGDGRVDVGTGKPLVCLVEVLGAGVGVSVNGTNLTEVPGETVGVAPAVVSLAAGIPDVKPVTLRLSGGRGLVELVSPARARLNLRADNELAYEVALRCPRSPAPSRHEVSLTAASPLGRLAAASLTLECQGLVPRERPADPVAVAAAVAAAAGPAAPVQGPPQTGVNPNPNVNPNTVPNVNANPGLAGNEETQGQLALVEGDDRPTEQLQMSAAFVGTAALLLCGSTVVAWRRQDQVQTG